MSISIYAILSLFFSDFESIDFDKCDSKIEPTKTPFNLDVFGLGVVF